VTPPYLCHFIKDYTKIVRTTGMNSDISDQPFLDKPDPEDENMIITTIDDLLHKVNG
jgi:hypothetical protein